MKKQNGTDKLAGLIVNGALTAKQIKRKTRLSDPYSAVRRLRKRGMCVMYNDGKYSNGKPNTMMVALAYNAYGASLFQG